MKATVIIERNDAGLYSVYMKEDRFSFGLNGQGGTVEEAKKDMLVAYSELKEMFTEECKDFPKLEFEYKYDTASFLEAYSKVLSLAGLERLTGVNQGQLSHYMTGHRKPNKKTIEKIEASLHKLGNDICQVQLI
jgi:hypothetical protein